MEVKPNFTTVCVDLRHVSPPLRFVRNRLCPKRFVVFLSIIFRFRLMRKITTHLLKSGARAGVLGVFAPSRCTCHALQNFHVTARQQHHPAGPTVVSVGSTALANAERGKNQRTKARAKLEAEDQAAVWLSSCLVFNLVF